MKVCPKCGATNRDKQFVGPFCKDCYSVDIKLKSDVLPYTVCKDCKNVKLLGEWVRPAPEIFRSYIKKIVKGKENYDDFDFDLDTGDIIFHITKEGVKFEVKKNIMVQKNVGLCDECSRTHGGYYEAIIQVRGTDEKVSRMMKKIKGLVEKITFISKEEKLKEGLDIYVGRKTGVEELLAQLGLKTKKSYKLYSMKEGKRIYRITYIVRV